MDWPQRLGLWRSLAMYYGVPGRQARMRRCYRQFINPGDLCFDIGAHVGNRLRAWRSLGARIVSLEPHPLMMNALQKRYGRDPEIELVQQAVGAEPGESVLYVSSRTPTVNTLSSNWQALVKSDPSFDKVEWDRQERVQVTTLDALIDQWGLPAFCKIDVEGYEPQVLRGLSRAIPALSFEYIPAALGMAHECIDLLRGLGRYEFNLSRGESHQMLSDVWLTETEVMVMVENSGQKSGDIYARRIG